MTYKLNPTLDTKTDFDKAAIESDAKSAIDITSAEDAAKKIDEVMLGIDAMAELGRDAKSAADLMDSLEASREAGSVDTDGPGHLEGFGHNPAERTDGAWKDRDDGEQGGGLADEFTPTYGQKQDDDTTPGEPIIWGWFEGLLPGEHGDEANDFHGGRLRPTPGKEKAAEEKSYWEQLKDWWNDEEEEENPFLVPADPDDAGNIEFVELDYSGNVVDPTGMNELVLTDPENERSGEGPTYEDEIEQLILREEDAVQFAMNAGAVADAVESHYDALILTSEDDEDHGYGHLGPATPTLGGGEGGRFEVTEAPVEDFSFAVAENDFLVG